MLAPLESITGLCPLDVMKHYKLQIEEFTLHAQQRFSNGDNIRELLHSRSYFTDQVLYQLWQHFELSTHDISLIAVGGFGRGELHPHSDIDLLLLSRNKVTPELSERISLFITLLWDIRFDVGHSVRTLKETMSLGRDDITVATNLMESRLLAGCPTLYNELETAVDHPKFWPSRDFYIAKRDEQIDRHRSGDSFDLEPNIKACAGGLRDIQTVGWIVKRHFKATYVEQLVAHGFLSQYELDQLLESQDYLWKMRFALHTTANRSEDKLLFNYQNEVAVALGYRDTQEEEGQCEQLAVEIMMKKYYQTIREISELCGMLLQLFKREVLGRVQQLETVEIDDNFRRIGSFVEAKSDDLFSEPHQIVSLFLAAAREPSITGIYAPTLRQLRQARYELETPLCEFASCRKAFMDILKHPDGINALSLMHKHGILSSYLPAWEGITGQMQFDLFHAYTVDEHTHRLLLSIDRFSNPKYKDEFPLCSVLVKTISKKGLLVLAAIFHDIGKGRGGDHSELGAQDALDFGALHDMNQHDSRLVAWLVENHLVMSTTAQRRDIHDPDVINTFAKTVQDEKRLAYLYCLTVADICSTNDNLWNNWKGSLLRELYFFTLRALRRGKLTEVDADQRIEEYKSKALQILANKGTENSVLARVRTLWQSFEPSYFLRHSPVEIANHSTNIVSATDITAPLVTIFNYDNKTSSELFVYTHDMTNLFAKVMRVLGSKNVQINDAHVMATEHGFALDTFTISEPDGSALVEPRRINSIIQTLYKSLTTKNFKPHRKRRIARQIRSFSVPTQIMFDKNENSDNTIFELVALDMPGLLATIGDVFTKHKINLVNAKITTIGERVEDFFIITDCEGDELTEQAQQTLKQALFKAIEKINN